MEENYENIAKNRCVKLIDEPCINYTAKLRIFSSFSNNIFVKNNLCCRGCVA